MKPTPKNWTRISTSLVYKDAARAIDWLCEAFGFEVRLKIEAPDGRIEHSELTFGTDGLIMVGEEDHPRRPEAVHLKSPRTISGVNTQSLMVYVDDVDAHCARAREAGARIVCEPKDVDYGDDYWADRAYECEDLEGHRWYFAQRIRDPA